MADSTPVHEAVVDALSAFEHPMSDKRTFDRRLAEFLESRLADRGVDVPTEYTPRGPADVTVGDVGVLVFTDFSHAKTVELRTNAPRFQEFGSLVVYGYRLPTRDLDRWRMGEFKYEALGLKLDEVTFLRRNPDTGSVEETGWPSRLWRFAEAVVALLAIVIGIELAVLYQAFGGQAPSAEITLVAVVGLSALLVFLYERVPF